MRCRSSLHFLARVFIFSFAIIFKLAFTAEYSFAAEVDLHWNANSEEDIAGYRIYYGSGSNNYQSFVTVGKVNEFRIYGLPSGRRFYFALTSYDTSGNESASSSEIMLDIPVSNPTEEADQDSDGLSDEDELALGSSPELSDSDGDGVFDGQEISDSTNLLDQGSGEPVLKRTVCAEWNGFLGGMWNILELVNRSASALDIEIMMYDRLGTEVYKTNQQIPPEAEIDSLVHQFPGWIADSYGKVCVRHHGNLGDLDGRMAYYKQNSSSKQGKKFDFAFAMPFANGKKGSQFVGFNTYQPSMLAADSNNLVANWIQLTNLGNQLSGGYLLFRDLDGVLIAEKYLILSAGQRVDTSAHQFGSFKAGVVEWRPDDASIDYVMRNVRYIYDNPGVVDSFSTAFQLEGGYGSGEQLFVPAHTINETSVLELSNVVKLTSRVQITVHSDNGNVLRVIEKIIPPYGSQHIILDGIIGIGKRAVVKIDGDQISGIQAVVMQYGKRSNGSIVYMYGIPAKVAFGLVLNGTYNTNIGQNSLMWLVNATPITEQVNLTLQRNDRTVLLRGATFDIEPYGLKVIDLNNYEEANRYGTAILQSAHNNAIISWITRENADFVMPTPVRQ